MVGRMPTSGAGPMARPWLGPWPLVGLESAFAWSIATASRSGVRALPHTD